MKPVCSNSCSLKYYLSLPKSERIVLRNKLAVKQLSTTQKRVPPKRTPWSWYGNWGTGGEGGGGGQTEGRSGGGGWRNHWFFFFFVSIFTQNWPPLIRSDNWMTRRRTTMHWYCNIGLHLAPVVQKLESAIHRLKCYPVINAIGFPKACPLDSDFSGG